MHVENTLRGLAALLTAALALLTAAPPIRAGSPAVLVVPDKICFPGDEIHIDATLSRSGLLGFFKEGIQGEVVRFFDPQGDPLRDMLTDASGMARVRFKAGPPGRYPFTVHLVDNPRYSADPATGNLFVRDKKTPLLFVAVETGLMPPNSTSLLPKEPEEAGPEPGSQEALSEVSACRMLVYITQACNPSPSRIRAWLEEKGYPAGPVCCLHTSFLTGFLPEAPAPDTDLLESLWKERSVPAHLLTRDHALAEAAADKGLHVLLLTSDDGANGTPPEKQEGERQEEKILPIHRWGEVPKICRCGAS